ncbi:MAG: hypothetical protein WBR26_21300 [Candidatus Acidiferrum sp.]
MDQRCLIVSVNTDSASVLDDGTNCRINNPSTGQVNFDFVVDVKTANAVSF